MALTQLLGSVLGARSGRKLGKLLGGSTGAMIGGMAGSLFGGRNLGRIKNMLPGGDGDDEGGDDSEPINEDEARIIIRAMCNSAKADGEIDDEEMESIIGQLDGLDGDDEAFFRAELKSDFISAQGIADDTPSSLSIEVYAVSTMSIHADNEAETSYLADLASALGIDPAQFD